MLKLIVGRAKSGKTTRLMEYVMQCPAYGMSERIVIVPEHLTHQTERTLSRMCGDRISYYSEVLSFTRLQNRVSSIYGGSARRTLDQAGRLLTARLALTAVQSRLKVFASASSRTEFLNGILSMIDEFKSYNVTPEVLLKASGQAEGAFAQKLLELSEILGAYDAVIAQGTFDPRDRLTFLYDQLRETDYADCRSFFVDGFIEFSSQELRILNVLMRRCREMVITLPWDMEERKGLFSPADDTMGRLISMAEACGRKVEIVEADFERHVPSALAYLEKNLFRYGLSPFTETSDAMKVLAAADRTEECRRCASELKRLALSGMRWKDMAVAAGDPEYYAPVLEAVFHAYGIPVYTGIKKQFTFHRAASFVLCALEAATEGMERESVIAALRSGYSDLNPDECDALENYAFTWSVSGSRWSTVWTEHPDGYDGKFTEQTRQDLDDLNELRVRAVAPLIRLSAGIRTAGNVQTQVQAIYRFLEETRLHDKISEQIVAETESGDQEAAQQTAQVWNTMLECLDQTVSVLGAIAVNGSELMKIFRTALSQYEIATIPAVLDCVSFGNMSSLRGAEPKVLYILGMNEGVLPAGNSKASLLNDRERSLLADKMQIQLAPDSEHDMEQQLFQIYNAMASPREKLYLSYVLTHDGESQQPSFLIGRIQKVFPSLQVDEAEAEVLDIMTEDHLTLLYLSAEEKEDREVRDIIRLTAAQIPSLKDSIVRAREAAIPRDLTVPKLWTSRLFGEEAVLTASRLDQLGKCPLNFFLNYGLKARRVREATFDAAEYGTFLHYILEKTVADTAGAGVVRPLDQASSRAMVQSYMEPYLLQRMQDTENLSAREKYLYMRNVDEAGRILAEISEELSVSDFIPCAYELRFGKDTQMGELSVRTELGAGRLDGTVDRVDIWRSPDRDYFRIIDYKSGSKTFDYTELSKGVGMQLFLYLFAIRHSGIPGLSDAPVPAGALYLPTRRSILTVEAGLGEVETERKKAAMDPKRSGLVLSDPAVLNAMEHDGTRFLPVKRIDKPDDYAVTPEQIDLLESFIRKQMGRAVDRIYGGDFQPEPYYRGEEVNACRYCDYADVCQKDTDFKKGFYTPKLSAQDFWSKIGGDENG